MPEIDQILEYKGWLVGGAFALLFAIEYMRPAVKPGPVTTTQTNRCMPATEGQTPLTTCR